MKCVLSEGCTGEPRCASGWFPRGKLPQPTGHLPTNCGEPRPLQPRENMRSRPGLPLGRHVFESELVTHPFVREMVVGGGGRERQNTPQPISWGSWFAFAKAWKLEPVRRFKAPQSRERAAARPDSGRTHSSPPCTSGRTTQCRNHERPLVACCVSRGVLSPLLSHNRIARRFIFF